MSLRIQTLTAVTLLALAAAVPGSQKPREDGPTLILRLFADEFVTLTPGTGPFPASFRMGSAGEALKHEQPAHTVTLPGRLVIAKYEVTQELYEVIMDKNPSRWRGPRNSVEMVNWEEAKRFCRLVTRELRNRKLVGQDEIIRLPSEAEWEFACRAGTQTRYSFGDEPALLTDYGWFTGNARGNDPPVGRKKPNGWGLYDLHGYVWEWCLDAWHPSYEGAPADGSAWEEKDAKERVVRGGSWAHSADHCRSAYRRPLPADHRSDAVGFRCIRAPEPKSPR